MVPTTSPQMQVQLSTFITSPTVPALKTEIKPYFLIEIDFLDTGSYFLPTNQTRV